MKSTPNLKQAHIVYKKYKSPLGTLVIATNGKVLTEVRFEDQRYFKLNKEWKVSANQPLLLKAEGQLTQYFKGKRNKFALALASKGTDFEEKVWKELRRIGYGKTSSYGEIAKAVGKPRASRAVGTAIGKNPLCIVVPCHRVLGAGGRLSGYAGGPERKRRLLAIEGVNLKAAKKVV